LRRQLSLALPFSFLTNLCGELCANTQLFKQMFYRQFCRFFIKSPIIKKIGGPSMRRAVKIVIINFGGLAVIVLRL
jgi:hypothetical protein